MKIKLKQTSDKDKSKTTIKKIMLITNNNSIQDNLQPVQFLSGLIRQAQSQENAACDLTKRAQVVTRPFVDKVEKIDTAKTFTAQRLRHCQLIVCTRLIGFNQYKD